MLIRADKILDIRDNLWTIAKPAGNYVRSNALVLYENIISLLFLSIGNKIIHKVIYVVLQ